MGSSLRGQQVCVFLSLTGLIMHYTIANTTWHMHSRVFEPP